MCFLFTVELKEISIGYIGGKMRTRSNWTPGQGSPRTIDLLNKTAEGKEEVIMKSGVYISLVWSVVVKKKRYVKHLNLSLSVSPPRVSALGRPGDPCVRNRGRLSSPVPPGSAGR